MNIGLIGCGNLGESFLRGLLKTELVRSDQIIASDPDSERRNIIDKLGVETTEDNSRVVKKSDTIFLAVKPGVVPEVLDKLDISEETLLVSLAAGVPLDLLRKHTPARLVRVMPNICGRVGEMASAFTVEDSARKEDRETVSKILNRMGTAVEVEESSMDAVTGLSGSGPAYIFLIIDALIEAGKEQGLEDQEAFDLAIQTVKGGAELVKKSDKKISELIEVVSSPKGTTVEGMKVLEDFEAKKSIKKAVRAATKRSEELSR